VRSFVRTTGGRAGTMLAVATLATAPAAASARTATPVVIAVPCDAARLSSAVAQANAAGAATIRLARNCSYVIKDELSFTGTGRTTLLGGPSTEIKGDPAAPPFRILFVDFGVTLRVQGIFILGGNGGGGIANLGDLTLNHVTLTGNNAISTGGGLNNFGRALITYSAVTANTALNGGGLWNGTTDATMTVFTSVIVGNNANHGGGVFTDGEGSTNIIQSTIAANTAPQGGGLYNNTNGRTRLNHTVVRQNKADLVTPDNGGGIFDAAMPGGVTIERTPVQRNTPNNCTPAISHCLG
jgi:hypothetical protein